MHNEFIKLFFFFCSGMNVCYKYKNMICRFRYPRRLYFGKARLCYRGAGGSGRKRVYIELPRDHPWLNPTEEVIQMSWGSNVDLQRVVEAPGSCAYVLSATYYTTATTKPDNDMLTKRLRASLARLPAESTVAQRMTKVTNAMLNTIQVPIQSQWAILLGAVRFPIVSNSHKCVDVVVVPPAMQARIINLDALSDSDANEAEVCTLSSKRQLVEAYMLRESCDRPCPLVGHTHAPAGKSTWELLCLAEFESNFFLTKSKNKDFFYEMKPYRVAMHDKPVGLATIPPITSDDTNEQSAYGTLFMYRPFRREADLYVIKGTGATPDVTTTAVEVLAHLKRTGELKEKAKKARQVEEMAASARASFGATDDDGDHFNQDGGGPCDAPGEVDDYIEFNDDGGESGAVPAWAAAPATQTLLDNARGLVTVVNFTEYTRLRNFAATTEREAKEARDVALSVFDSRGAKSSNGDEDDFSAASSVDETAISLKEAELERKLEELSPEQRDAFECIKHYVKVGSKAGQLVKILAGAAGVGKSKLLHVIVLWVRLQFGSKSVEVTAHTNAAARLVDGHTFDSIFLKFITMCAKDEKARTRQANAISAFRARFANVRLIIFEENSFTSCEDVLRAHECFQLAFPERAHLPFAGFHVGNNTLHFRPRFNMRSVRPDLIYIVFFFSGPQRRRLLSITSGQPVGALQVRLHR